MLLPQITLLHLYTAPCHGDLVFVSVRVVKVNFGQDPVVICHVITKCRYVIP